MLRSPNTAVVLTDAAAVASSESEINAAVCLRLLPKLYPTVLVNPERLPRKRTRFDLWSIFPWRCHPPLPWREITARADARIAIDVVDQMPGHDVFMLTNGRADSNPTLDRLLNLWSAPWGDTTIRPTWRAEYTKPHLPFILPCAPMDVPAEHPRKHVMWNVQHWSDNRAEHAVAVAALPMLKRLGVEMVFLTRWDRGGVPFDDLVDAELTYCALDLLKPAREYEGLFATAFAYLISVPAVGMYSVERALVQGVPVIGAPTHRWSTWFTPPSQLPAYRADPMLYAVGAGVAEEYRFSEAAAVAQMEMACRLGHQLRGRD